MNDSVQQIAALLEETQHAHHQAFMDADGYDPDWPLWYAGYLIDKLPALLGVPLTISELTYWMVLLNRRQPEEAPDEQWTHYYAACLVDEYQ